MSSELPRTNSARRPRTPQIKRIIAGAGLALVVTGVAATAVIAGPSMSSAWDKITVEQDDCLRKASASLRANDFETRFEVVNKTSVYGERGDYTALARCAANMSIVYFVVAGPDSSKTSQYMNTIRAGF